MLRYSGCFVAGMGTGGTIMGVGEYLRGRAPGVRVVAVEPAASPALPGGKPGSHGIQGIGAGLVPGVLDTAVYGGVSRVTNGVAVAATRAVGHTAGVLVGISAGASAHAAIEVAKRPEFDGVVTLLPETGER